MFEFTFLPIRIRTKNLFEDQEVITLNFTSVDAENDRLIKMINKFKNFTL